MKAILEDGRVKNVKGAWGWISDRTAVFRPAKYWPGRATITVASVASLSVWPPAAGAGLAYLPPAISRVYGPGAKNADTGGGQLVFIEGAHFGPLSYPVRTVDWVTYGAPPGDTARYAAAQCVVSQAPPPVAR